MRKLELGSEQLGGEQLGSEQVDTRTVTLTIPLTVWLPMVAWAYQAMMTQTRTSMKTCDPPYLPP